MFKELKEAFGFYADAPNGQKTDMKLTKKYAVEAMDIKKRKKTTLNLVNVSNKISIATQDSLGQNLLHYTVYLQANTKALSSFIAIARERGELETALSQKNNSGQTVSEMIDEKIARMERTQDIVNTMPDLKQQQENLFRAKEIIENTVEHLKLKAKQKPPTASFQA